MTYSDFGTPALGTINLNSVADPFGIAVNVLDEDPSIDLRQLIEDVGKALGE